VKPWEGANLTLWNAVRLTVSLTNAGGEMLAELLADPSPVGRRVLSIGSDEHRRALMAYRPATSQLEEWCQQGKVPAHGYFASSPDDARSIDPHHWVGRDFDYGTSELKGGGLPPIRFVTLAAAHIRELCAAAHGGPPSVRSKPGRRATNQITVAESILKCLREEGIDVQPLSNKQLVGMVKDRAGQVAISPDTILRVAGRKKRHVHGNKGKRQLP
jgi:hypothetical protein